MTRSGEQTVFASSEAKGSKAKDAAAKRSTDAGTAPTTRSATGNLWSGFAPEKSSSLPAAGFAAEPPGESGGLGLQAISLAVLGLGLTGLLGGALVAAARRQRVQAGRSSGGNAR